MYFNTVSQEKIVDHQGRRWRPFSNCLYAIAEWQRKQQTEPLEITARKLRKYYEELAEDQQDEATLYFQETLYKTLYKSLLDRGGRLLEEVDGNSLRAENRTLRAVAELCEAGDGAKGVQSVITYNYDNLLECVLKDRGVLDAMPVCGEVQIPSDQLPIYHVHGILPIHHEQDFQRGAIVFTEEDYHQAADDPYPWSNIVQLQAMSNTTSLMIGHSMTDCNMRRLLDAVRRAPVRGGGYALLKRERFKAPDIFELRKMHSRAKELISEFEDAGIRRDWGGHPEATGEWVESQRMKPGKPASPRLDVDVKVESRFEEEIIMILQGVHRIEEKQQERTLLELGVTPVWFDSFEEIASFIEKIPNGT